ncbi:uncharacterized protein LOC133531837 [Cydia pomonella]|uniref:uncharacterized protein LOC133531837 n=1 Tax=Cydia pomonella TaxID=82600 RepID=UPI002ADE3C3B|nr:uncharacterized protein LOC133531837 [Cydia pomonella]
MATEIRCKELIKKRGTVKAKLTQFTAYLATAKSCAQLSDPQLVELDLRITKIDALYESYDTFQSELEQLVEDPSELYTDREQFEGTYYHELATARELLERHRSQRAKEYASARSEVGSDECPTVISCRQSNVRLPKINLPHFSGGCQNWLEFKDIYVSLIHTEKSIDDINKFHYLRASLHGSAAIVIRSLDFRAENYNAAWKLLCDRYDNKQLLVNNHVQALFNIDPIHRESCHGLRQIVDTANKNLRALATLDQPVDHWDTLVIHIMSSKLDNITSRKWEEHRNSLSEPPSLDNFLTFLSNRCNLLETLEESKNNKSKAEPSVSKPKSFAASSSQHDSAKKHLKPCPLCNKNHYIFNCDTFRALPVDQRWNKAKEHKVCLNCLRPGHHESKCSLSHCKYCKVRHNTLLHTHNDTNTPTEHVALSATNHVMGNVSPHVFLSTAQVKVSDSKGQLHTVRIMLDNGSTANYISQSLTSRLSLPTRPIISNTSGLNEQESKGVQACSLHMESRDGTFKTDIDCYILPKVTRPIPDQFLNVNEIPIPSGLCLADPSYYEPSSINLLVGAQIFWAILGSGRIDLGKQNPLLAETKLGWLVVGALYQPSLNKPHNPVCFFLNDQQTGIDLTPFWELDTIPSEHNRTVDENTCEQIFTTTTKRDEEGRFVVTMPLKESPDVLGSSFELARRRFLSLEQKFDRDPLFRERYVDFITEYETLGHMSESFHDTSRQSYFLPHHGILRDSSSTTKLRAVFDASAATTSGKSLNDIQLVGPRIQDDLFSILLRFRQHKFVVSADIEKMYRQILVDEEQRSLQKILWRANPSQPIKIYTLNTVTYGTASAPYLSTRCLLQLAQDSLDKQTQDAISKDFYVDDFLSGSHSIADTVSLCQKVTDTLRSAKFNLRKWQSNSEQILKQIKNEPSLNHTVNLSEKELSKTLGISWHCTQDTLTFQINISVPSVVTKRTILSAIAQIFDPLGLVTPCIVEAKILMQKLWVDKMDWDQPLSGSLLTSWNNFAKTLPNLNNVNIPRWILCESFASIEFHIFTDASERAYGACLYVRSVAGDGSVCVRLLASKSKIAPIKATTIPRLELCAALLGTRLCTKVLESLTLKPERCIFWCDSMIVLGWLKSSPALLRPFVKNRISEIQDSFQQECWRYVPSKENSADLVSRGLDADLIQTSSLWWSGPSFLASDSSHWPTTPGSESETSLPEIITHKSFVITSSNSDDANAIQTLINNRSDYAKIQRVIAYIKRFTYNCQNASNKKQGYLTASELSAASTLILRISQQTAFPEDYELLKSGKELPKQSRLKSLSPFYDAGLIRVGGRLLNSFYDYDVKHPIIVCCKQPIIRLLVRMLHLRALHAGPQLLMTVLRQNYWPLGGRNLVKHTVQQCIRCIRLKAETIQPVMGNLPKERLHLEFPFIETGTDYAGPILIADRKGRGCRLVKAYICIFVCLATRALHLELVSDLTKEAFIAALDRFIARRGKPRTIFSDNGTTFVGAANELANVLNQDLAKDRAAEGINFSFIPAYTPHFGGLWESAVKSVKHHLRRVLGLTHLTFEEMATCLSQVEAILNSRPLTPLSDDPSDLIPLTPSHFLIGRSLTAVPHRQVSSQNISSLQRFQRIEVLKQHFWNRFSSEYIFSLQQRTKWRSSRGRLEVGTMVVVKENNQPPLMWLMGRIVNVLPGKDGVARVADIKTKKGIIRRAFNTICPLPIYSLEDNESSTPGVYGGDSTNASS